MKAQVQKQPTRGGLTPVRVDALPYKTGLTIDLVCKEINIKPRFNAESVGDSIEVKYEKRFIDEDGYVVSVQKLAYTVKDTGDLCSYDLYEDTLFDQVDIDNPSYDVAVNANGEVTSISYIDGQIEEEDPENPGVMVMVDNVVNVEPLHRKGQIDPSTETIVTAGSEPLADWTYAMGAMITAAVVNQMRIRNGY